MIALALLGACAEPPPMPPPLSVGVTGSSSDALRDALAAIGAREVALRPGGDVSLDGLDALLLGPGADLHPDAYGEAVHPANVLIPRASQELDLDLARAAVARDMPVLGVCLGAQELSVALGGSLVQDVPSEVGGAVDHRAPHAVRLGPNDWYPDDTIVVHSNHHQAVDHAGAHLTVLGRAEDGVAELIAAPDHLFAVGVQFHPERAGPELTPQDGLWGAFADAARTYRERGPGAVVYAEPGQVAPPFPTCEVVHAPFDGDRRSLAALRPRLVGRFGDYRRSYVKGHAHGGIDLEGGFGEPVYALCAGRVADIHLGFPHRTVVVEHRLPDARTVYSSYKHVTDVPVGVGDYVDERTAVGRLHDADEHARSPFATNHLHLEIRHDISDEGTASWTSMSVEELRRFAFDPWVFLTERLGA